MSAIVNGAMKVMVKCEGCDNKFEVVSGESIGSIIHKKKFRCEEKSLYLTFFDCPKCGIRHFVQIDDKYSLNLLNDVSRQFVKLSSAKKKDKEIPQNQLAKFNKSRQHLSDYRNGLMKGYTGKLVYDSDTDSTFVLKVQHI